MESVLLVGGSADALEAKRVVLEGAGFTVRVLASGESVRATAEEMAAALIMMMDVSAEGPDARRALAELASGEPSTIPVLVIGGEDALRDFDGPAAAVGKPPQKRALLDSARTLIAAGRRPWSERKKA